MPWSWLEVTVSWVAFLSMDSLFRCLSTDSLESVVQLADDLLGEVILWVGIDDRAIHGGAHVIGVRVWFERGQDPDDVVHPLGPGQRRGRLLDLFIECGRGPSLAAREFSLRLGLGFTMLPKF